MERRDLSELQKWTQRRRRKPLLIRGARQVGKTTMIRMLAKSSFKSFVEINFERNPKVAELFASKNPKEITRLLELQFATDITPGRTLLFLDEIQAAPQVIATLRYFYEEMPKLHVIAAGSLLEFALAEPVYSVPVGRIDYLYLGPMQFSEFLLAAGQDKLASFLREYTLGQEIPSALHDRLMALLRQYIVVGGMPEAIEAFLESGDYREADIVKHSILATFHDDFGKYGPRANVARVRKVFESLPRQVGKKLKYVNIDREERPAHLAEALQLLSQARLVYPVYHSAANGLHLKAGANERFFKPLYLDVGLMNTAMGLSALDIERAEDLLMVHQGAVCEQLVGQHLLYSPPAWKPPQLHYWTREKRSSSAEVDYLISCGERIIPVEVKAGKTGTLKSLHVFLREKGRNLAVRLNATPPSVFDASTSIPGQEVSFRLISLPLYLASEVERLCLELDR